MRLVSFPLFAVVLVAFSAFTLAIPADAACWQSLGSGASANGVDFAISPDSNLYTISTSNVNLFKSNGNGTWAQREVMASPAAIGIFNSSDVLVAGRDTGASGLEPAVKKVTGFTGVSVVQVVAEDYLQPMSTVWFTRVTSAGSNLFLVADPGLFFIYWPDRNAVVGLQRLNGSNVTAVAADGSALLVGASNGSLGIVDAATLQFAPIRSPTAYSITAVIRASNGELYVADAFHRVFYSSNNGSSWDSFVLPDPFPLIGFTERGGIVYAATDNVNRLYATVLGSNAWQVRPIPQGTTGVPRIAAQAGKVYTFLRDNSAVLAYACPNTPPKANPGADEQVAASSSFQLDASSSSDEQGDLLSYAWTFPPTDGLAGLSNSTSPHVNGFANQPGAYIFTLVVTDSGFPNMSSAPAQVKLTVTPSGGEAAPAPTPAPSTSPTTNLPASGQPAAQCTSNSNCRVDETCAVGQCKPLTCTGEQAVYNHTCIAHSTGQPSPAVQRAGISTDVVILAVLVLILLGVIAYLALRKKK